MSPDRCEWIFRYLDDDLSAGEHCEFQKWLTASSDHMAQFVQVAMLHDRLRGELTAMSMTPTVDRERAGHKSNNAQRHLWNSMTVVGAAVAAIAVLVVLWHGIGDSPVSAATELDRLIDVQDAGRDRTYHIAVEGTSARRQTRRRADDTRPPKPPMDGATLHVRHGNQFVLIRQTHDGLPFVTGCDGRVSWAVRPHGPVRVSADLTRFNRDVPGHEHGMPLINLEEALERLKAAYDLQLLPVEAVFDRSSRESTRLFVAAKRRGFRGPQRVEITFQVSTGLIQQLRFVEMPYGPDRLSLRLSLLDERDLGATFFEHQSHHASDRTIEEE